jgi:hypothetical protein
MESKVIVHISGTIFAFGKLSPDVLASLSESGSIVHFHKTLSAHGIKRANEFLVELGLREIKPLTAKDVHAGHNKHWLMKDFDSFSKYLEFT